MEKLTPSYTYMQQYVLNCDLQFPLIAYRPVPVNCKPVDSNGNELIGAKLTQFYTSLFQSVQDCGFNIVTIPTGSAENNRILTLGVLSSLKFIPYLESFKNLLNPDSPKYFNEKTKSDIDEELGIYESNDKIWAIEIYDEPKAAIWQNVASGTSPDSETCNLKNVYDYVATKVNSWGGTKKYVFFNIAATTDKSVIGNIATNNGTTSFSKESLYYRYLKELQTTFAPQIWSYAYYPIISDPFWESDNTTLVVPDVKSEYYGYLTDLARISSESSRPLLAYVLCTPHYWYDGKGNAPENIRAAYPSPTVEHLRFQAFTAIAFGAKGLVFWNYGQGEYKIEKFPMPESDAVYTDAAINVNGVKTSIWNMLKTVLTDIKQSSNLFLQSTLLKVQSFTNGTSSVLLNRSNGADDAPDFKLKGDKFSVLASSFKVGIGLTSSKFLESHLILLVNKEIDKSQNFSISIKNGNYKYSLITPDTVNGNPATMIGLSDGQSYTKYQISIAAGGYALIKVSPKATTP